MSIRALNWAWSWTLAPAPKLILLALADNSDDHGVSFPSVSYVAQKVSLGRRATQRRIQELAAQDLVRIEIRCRRDGSHTSNRYYLRLDRTHDGRGGAISTPPSGVRHVTGAVNSRTGPQGETHTPLTTNLTINETTTTQRCESRSVAVATFPAGWSCEFNSSLAPCLVDLPPSTAQELVDELVGRMASKTISNPVGYLRALRSSYEKGKFNPEMSHRVKAARSNATLPSAETPTIQPQATRESALRAISTARAQRDAKSHV